MTEDAYLSARLVLNKLDRGAQISYAQNWEDVIARRILKNITWDAYIDVGAADPYWNSISCGFYLDGRSGLTIDPRPAAISAHRTARPRDTQVQQAVSNYVGTATLWEPEASTHATINRNLGEIFTADERPVEMDQMPVTTLSKLLSESSHRSIGLCSIDAEGMELEILEGLDLQLNRPFLIIFESLVPPRSATTSAFSILLEKVFQSRRLLGQSDYKLVYQDGINDFWVEGNYVAAVEEPVFPPNYYDNFVTYREVCLARALMQKSDARRL